MTPVEAAMVMFAIVVKAITTSATSNQKWPPTSANQLVHCVASNHMTTIKELTLARYEERWIIEFDLLDNIPVVGRPPKNQLLCKYDQVDHHIHVGKYICRFVDRGK